MPSHSFAECLRTACPRVTCFQLLKMCAQRVIRSDNVPTSTTSNSDALRQSYLVPSSSSSTINNFQRKLIKLNNKTQNAFLSASGREREANCYQTNVKLNQKVHKIQLTAIYWRDKNWNVCRWYVKKSLSLLSVKLSAMFIFSSLWLVPLSFEAFEHSTNCLWRLHIHYRSGARVRFCSKLSDISPFFVYKLKLIIMISSFFCAQRFHLTTHNNFVRLAVWDRLWRPQEYRDIISVF